METASFSMYPYMAERTRELSGVFFYKGTNPYEGSTGGPMTKLPPKAPSPHLITLGAKVWPYLGTEEVTNIQSIATGDWYGGKEENRKSLQKSSVTGGLFPGSNKAGWLLCRFMVCALMFLGTFLGSREFSTYDILATTQIKRCIRQSF